MKRTLNGATKGVGMALLLSSVGGAVAADGGDREARAVMRLCTDAEVVVGEAKLRERKSEEGIKLVEIDIDVAGLTPGKHAVHIHETGTCRPCGAANGHFDPGLFGMTNPDGNHPFHSGDLINIEGRRNGKGKLRTETTRITLSPGPLSLFDADGSAFIIHDDADTYCPEGATEPGCAGGSRFACGIIEPGR